MAINFTPFLGRNGGIYHLAFRGRISYRGIKSPHPPQQGVPGDAHLAPEPDTGDNPLLAKLVDPDAV